MVFLEPVALAIFLYQILFKRNEKDNHRSCTGQKIPGEHMVIGGNLR